MSAEARREQLLDVTTGIVVQRGFHDVSIEAVARHAGVTRALIYQHFPDLGRLLEAVVEREMGRALGQVSETTPTDLSGDDPRARMLESLQSFLTAVREHPSTWRLVLMPPESAPEILRRNIAHGRARVLAQLTGAVRPLLAAGRASDHPELTARVLSAVSDEYARMVLTDPIHYSPERLLRHADWWLRGFSL
jgi:AcrR family transcriptional regulator